MNYKMIFFIMGKMLIMLSAFMLLPIVCSLIYKEDLNITLSFFKVSLFSLILSIVITILTKKNNDRNFYNKEGFVIVTFTWIVYSVLGALPFYLSGSIPSYVDSFFETVSGFTTTGSSILSDIEVLPKSMLLWRSFTHFIGGMGFILFALAVLPRSPHNIHIAKAEVPGPYFGKVVSSIKQTAIYLYGIYVVLTLIMFVLLLFSHIGIFESLNVAFSTAGTGGFATKNAGILFYNSNYVTIITIVFMLIFSMNLNLVYFIIFKKYFKILKSEELRWFLLIVFMATLIIFFNISYQGKHTFLEVLFTVSSIVSTTGFSYVDFNIWPLFSKIIILLLMIIGGCSGGTAGGLKIPRVMFFVKNARNSVRKAINPKKIVALKIEGKVIKDTTPLANYLLLYALICMIILVIVSIQVNDFEDALSLVVTTISNAGPAFNNYGPANNFSLIPEFTKVVLAISMLLGRLELIPLIVLFSAKTWRKKQKIKK